ncbi:hypothetical protein AS160_03125 [Marinitoga sp. 38H-ov]|nr:SLC13 family permease [Marinitoga sp. 38H-ov]KAF2956993.1 hypothetical protein AS160_03125 [Marinitoga sp. 38H-ov]
MLFIGLYIFIKPQNIISHIEWNTIIFLSGLIMITKAMEESNYFFVLSEILVNKLNYKRNLVMFLIFISIFFSMFLTNDITLFIIIPFTTKLKKVLKGDYLKTIFLEIISVNVGSELTPIGNPQNVFIWQKYNITFSSFILNLLPLFIFQFILIYVFIVILIKNEKIDIYFEKENYEHRNFYISLLFLILFIFATKNNFSLYALILFSLYYIFFDYKVIRKADWNLIFTFILFFINFGMISEINIVKDIISHINLENDFSLLSTSVILSQLISNVPATIFISSFSDNWNIISIGVNLGGTGFVLGSLANIIGLRLSGNISKINLFHIYSFSFFIISYIFTVIYYNPHL